MACIPGEKILHPCMLRKKILPPEVWGKKVLPNPDHPYHPLSLPHLKSQMVGPLPTTST